MNLSKDKNKICFTLLAIIVVATLLRINLYLNTSVIGSDSAFFLWGSRYLDEGEEDKALKYGHHPLYPICISLVNAVLKDYEISGYVVSIFFSVLTIIPLYLVTSCAFNKRAGLMCAFLFAVHSKLVDSGSDVMTESTFLFFTSLGLYFLTESFVKPSLRNFIWGGITTGLAHLTRPEGLILLIAFFVCMIVNAANKKISLKNFLARGSLVVFCFFLTTILYLLFVYFERGVFWISIKSTKKLFTHYQISDVIIGSLSVTTDKTFLAEFIRCIGKSFALYIPFFLCIVFIKKKNTGNLFNSLIVFSLTFWFVMTVVVFMLFRSSGYVGYRHLLILHLVTLPFISGGIIELKNIGNCKRIVGCAFWVTTFALITFNLTFTIKPRRQDQKVISEAGAFIKEDFKKRIQKKILRSHIQGENLELTPSQLKPKILATGEKVVYYADGIYTSLSEGSYKNIVKIVKSEKIDYFVIDLKDLEDMKSDFLRECGKGNGGVEFVLLKMFGEGKKKLLVFAVNDV